MENSVANKMWNDVLALIAKEVSTISFETWFMPVVPVTFVDNCLTVEVPGDFHKSHIEQYSPLIETTIKFVSGYASKLNVILTEEKAAYVNSLAKKSAADRLSSEGSSLNPLYTFEKFVVGPGNRFAQAACIAVAENKGKKNFNPLFLYGGSGLGKTHLMHAIGNYAMMKNPSRKVLYVQSERFVNEFINTIQSGKYEGFRNKYRNVDILMIDDIQFIEGMNQMQMEFFHTFNSLYESGKYIVMTCDKPPNSLAKLEERLKTRFSSGLIVDIQPPDYETRVAIMRKIAVSENIDIPDDVFDYIATNIATNIRELEGALNTVICYASLSGKINLSITREALKDVINPEEAGKLTNDFIMDVVSNYFNISVTDLKSKKRSNEVAIPRQIAMYFCRNMLDLTYPQIGNLFGKRDHSTVMHACSKISEEIKNDSKLAEDIEELSKRISG